MLAPGQREPDLLQGAQDLSDPHTSHGLRWQRAAHTSLNVRNGEIPEDGNQKSKAIHPLRHAEANAPQALGEEPQTPASEDEQLEKQLEKPRHLPLKMNR